MSCAEMAEDVEAGRDMMSDTFGKLKRHRLAKVRSNLSLIARSTI